LEPEHIIDETVTIEDVYIEDVYKISLIWLEKIRSTFEVTDLNTFIRARHEGEREDHIEDYPKIIEIHLKPIRNNVLVRMTMDQTWKKSPIDSYENRRNIWKNLVEDYWRELGVEITDDVLRYLHPAKNLDKDVEWRWGLIQAYIILALFFFLVGVNNPTVGVKAGYLTFILLLICFFEYWGITKIRKRKRSLYA
jgi:hypothetical protein